MAETNKSSIYDSILDTLGVRHTIPVEAVRTAVAARLQSRGLNCRLDTEVRYAADIDALVVTLMAHVTSTRREVDGVVQVPRTWWDALLIAVGAGKWARKVEIPTRTVHYYSCPHTYLCPSQTHLMWIEDGLAGKIREEHRDA